MAKALRTSTVVLISALLSGAYIAWRLAGAGWDPVGLAEVGTRFSTGDPQGTSGYDGQFALFIALDPDPERVAEMLDVPAYRYQRILYPLLARLLSGGQPPLIPWMLILINFLGHLGGTWVMARLLKHYQLPPGYALVYGLWVGLVMSTGLDMTEPLGFALVVAGWWFYVRHHSLRSALLFLLAIFTRELGAAFLAAVMLGEICGPRRRQMLLPQVLVLTALAGWQLWLWAIFRQPGIGLGGDMATPLELIPFMGLWRVAAYSLPYFLILALIFIPSLVLPASWGLIASLKALRRRPGQAESWALLIHAVFMVILPFAVYREPLGLVRIATGLVLAVLLFAARQGSRRVLNYSLFWSVLLVIALKG